MGSSARLQVYKMTHIPDEGLDISNYPLCNAIVSTEDWFIIYARQVSFFTRLRNRIGTSLHAQLCRSNNTIDKQFDDKSLWRKYPRQEQIVLNLHLSFWFHTIKIIYSNKIFCNIIY